MQVGLPLASTATEELSPAIRPTSASMTDRHMPITKSDSMRWLMGCQTKQHKTKGGGVTLFVVARLMDVEKGPRVHNKEG